MDTVPMFVQLTKLVEAELGMGNARVRPPLELVGSELEQAKRGHRCRITNPAGHECVNGSVYAATFREGAVRLTREKRYRRKELLQQR
jgi:hypothetical protein